MWERLNHDGKGTFSFPDGSRYEGEFSGGQFQGPGAFFWPDGSRYTGTWIHNCPWARCLHRADGQRFEGQWEQGGSTKREDQTQGRGGRTLRLKAEEEARLKAAEEEVQVKAEQEARIQAEKEDGKGKRHETKGLEEEARRKGGGRSLRLKARKGQAEGRRGRASQAEGRTRARIRRKRSTGKAKGPRRGGQRKAEEKNASG
jgi:hypothetical protein